MYQRVELHWLKKYTPLPRVMSEKEKDMEIKKLRTEDRGSFGIMTKFCVDDKMHFSEFFANGVLGKLVTLTHFRPCDGRCGKGEILDEHSFGYRKKKLLEEMIEKIEEKRCMEVKFVKGGYRGRYREDF
jgi:hypothetical protein